MATAEHPETRPGFRRPMPPLYPEREEAALTHRLDQLRNLGIVHKWQWWTTVTEEVSRLRADVLSGKHPPIDHGPEEPLLNGEGQPYESGLRSVDPHVQDVFYEARTVRQINRAHDQIALLARKRESDSTEDAEAGETERWIHNLYVVTLWRAYGRKTYVLEPDLYELLIRTDVPSLPASELRFPINAFYLVLPPGVVRVDTPVFDAVAGKVQGRSDVEGLLVIVDRASHEENWVRRLHLAYTSTASFAGESNFNTLHFTTDMDLQPTATLRALDESGRGTVDDDGVRWASVGVTEDDSVTRLLVNFCLYLQSEHPELEAIPAPPVSLAQRRSTTRERSRVPETSRLGYVRVGRPIDERSLENFVAPDAVASAGGVDAEPGAVAAPRWRLSHQVWVRGHWRLQPFGTGRVERKLIWIKPHIKGPDLAEALRLSGGKVQPGQRVGTSDVVDNSLVGDDHES